MGAYLIAVGVMMLLDILTGVIKALKEKAFSSVKAKEGLYNKCGYIIVLAVAGICEYSMGTMELGFEIPLMGPTCIYIFVTELTSILENVSVINPKILHFASKYLEQIPDEHTGARYGE